MRKAGLRGTAHARILGGNCAEELWASCAGKEWANCGVGEWRVRRCEGDYEPARQA